MGNKQPTCNNCHSFLKRIVDDEFSLKSDGIEINVLICKRCGNNVVEFWMKKGFFASIKRLFKRSVFRIITKYPNFDYVYRGDKK